MLSPISDPLVVEVNVIPADRDASAEGQTLRPKIKTNLEQRIRDALRKGSIAEQVAEIQRILETDEQNVSRRHVKRISFRIAGKTGASPFSWADSFEPKGS